MKLLNQFEAYLLTEKHVSHNTFLAYMRDIRHCNDFILKHSLTFETMTLDTLKKYLKSLKEQKITAQTISRKISTLKVFCAWTHQQYGWTNHAKELLFPKLEKKLPKYLSETEVQELLDVAHRDTSENSKRNLVMLYLLYSSGLRISELTMLKTADFDFDSGCLTIMGKGNKQRAVPLTHHTITLVKDYLETVHKKFVITYGTTNFLFPCYYAALIKPISRQAFWAILKELCKKTSIIRSVSPHMLRHSLATHLLKNGAHLRSLQLLLGHENLSTVQIYTHIEMSYLRTIYNKKHPRS